MNDFKPMHTVIPEGRQGVAEVKHFEVDQEKSLLSALRREPVPPGKYARLMVRGGVMMSDTPMEHRTNWEVCSRATGKVLIAGLGLGMILVRILEKPEVESVLVIEKEKDVIDLVEPHVRHPKLTVLHKDIFDFKPAKGQKWNTIYFDIWPDVCTENLKQMTTLHRRFGQHLDRSGDHWIDSWRRGHLKVVQKREAREERTRRMFRELRTRNRSASV